MEARALEIKELEDRKRAIVTRAKQEKAALDEKIKAL